MKTVTTLIAILFFASASLAQDANATTETEYNFATVGYLRVLNEGADMKESYTTKKLLTGATTPGGTFSSSFRFDVEALQKENKTRAIMIIHYSADKAKTIYCLPLYDTNSTLWNKFIDESDKLTGAHRKQFTIALTRAWAWTLKK